MHFDAMTLACVASELNQTVVGGRIQQVLHVDDQSIGLEIYAQQQRQYLLLAAHAASGRVHRVSQKLRRGTDAQPPLLLLLRKYARGGALDAVTQLAPTERVLQLHFDHPEHGTTTLVAELIGRASNLILLTPDGDILDCLRRVRPREASGRALLPGRAYAAPPPQEKLPPLDDQRPDYYEQLAQITQAEGTLWRALVTAVAGTSPTLAREIAWRVTGAADAPAQEADVVALAQTLQAIWAPVQTGQWQPGLVYAEGDIIGFAAYPLHFRGEFVPTDSISAALEQFYADRAQSRARVPVADGADTYAVQRAKVAELIQKGQERVQRQLAAAASDEPEPGEADRLRTQAEWVLALSSQISADQEVLEVELADGPLRIPLDRRVSPVEQAQRMFDRAAKLERAAAVIPKRRAALQADLEFLEQLQLDLVLAENQPEIAAVQAELQRAGLLTDPQQQTQKTSKTPRARPLRYLSPDGLAILVGRNARQNEVVTFEMANAADLWLHARDAPGSHVVVRSGGQPVSEATRHAAAQLAAYYSRLRGERAAPVMVTQRRFVTRVPGGRPGQVHVRNDETITVPADLPDDAIESTRER